MFQTALGKAPKRYLQPAERNTKLNIRHHTSRLDLTKLVRPSCENSTALSASTKPFFLSHNLAHLFFAKGCKKPNKLNYLPTKQGVLSALFCASHVRSVKAL